MDKLYNYFKRISENKKMSHAFLIGNVDFLECKNELEKILSDFIFFDNIKIDNNPDILILDSSDTSTVNVKQVKDLLLDISKTSQVYGKKVYIISNCEKLSDKIYNKMLKTIEEPEDNIYAFLITSNIENVVDTLRSRCQEIFISSNVIMSDDADMRSTAIDFINKVEKNKLKTIAKNNEIYSIIVDRDNLRSFTTEIFRIYMNELYCLLNYKENVSIVNIPNKNINNLCKKVLIINNIIEKKDININKDLVIDKIIIEIWRCNNEININ